MSEPPKKRGRKLEFAGKGAPELRVRIPDPALLAACQSLGPDWVRDTLARAVKREQRKSSSA